MSENMQNNVQLDANANGTVSFATDVIATIAGLAATEVEGVASMVSTQTGGFAEIFKRGQNTRSLTKGVRVELNDNTVAVQLTIVVDYGTPVPDVAKSIQENVKKAIENMSGLEVTAVNVHVHGVSFEKENRATAEIEAQQRLMLQKKQEEKPAEQPAEEKEIIDEPAPVVEVSSSAAAAEEEEEDDGEYVLDLGDEPELDEEEAEETEEKTAEEQ